MSAQVEKFTRRFGSALPWWINQNPELDSTILPGDSIETILEKAGLNWKAEKTDLFQVIGQDENGENIYAELSNEYLIRRNTDFMPLGIFGRNGSGHSGYYEPNEPRVVVETLLEFCQVAANEVGLQLETAGSLANGKKIWAQAIIPDDFKVAGDEHERYISFLDSFDGSTCFTGQAGLTRIVCANTFAYSLSEQGNPRVKLNHSREFKGERKDKFVAMLKAIMAGHTNYKLAAELLDKHKFSKDDAHKWLSALLFTPEIKPVKAANGEMVEIQTEPSTKTKNNIQSLIDCYNDTLEEGTNKGTLWTVFNSVTRYADHEMGVKKRGGKDEYQARVESAGFGAGQKLKEKAFSELYELAKAA